MYSDRRGNGQKPPRTNNPREQLRENLYRGLLSGFFVLGLLKIGGIRDVWRIFVGGPGICDKVWQGEGAKLAKKIAWHTLWTAPRSAGASWNYTLTPQMFNINILYFMSNFSFKADTLYRLIPSGGQAHSSPLMGRIQYHGTTAHIVDEA